MIKRLLETLAAFRTTPTIAPSATSVAVVIATIMTPFIFSFIHFNLYTSVACLWVFSWWSYPPFVSTFFAGPFSSPSFFLHISIKATLPTNWVTISSALNRNATIFTHRVVVYAYTCVADISIFCLSPNKPFVVTLFASLFGSSFVIPSKININIILFRFFNWQNKNGFRRYLKPHKTISG